MKEKSKTRKDSIIDTFRHLCPEVEESSIRSFFRVGKAQKDKPRLIVVKLSDAKVRSELIAKSRNTPIPGNIKIRVDLTRTEREEERKFFKNLKDLEAPTMAWIFGSAAPRDEEN